MDYQDRTSKINLRKLLPKSVAIFAALIFILFVVGLFPGSWMIVLATIAVISLIITQAIVILKDDSSP